MGPEAKRYDIKLSNLLISTVLITTEERKYIYRARQRLEAGQDLEFVMNELGLALVALDFGRIQVGGLTPAVKIFFEELKERFGEPKMNDIYAENLAKIPRAITKYNWSTIWFSLLLLGALIIYQYLARK